MAKKNWTYGGVRGILRKAKKGHALSRKCGSGRTRTSLAPSVLAKIKEHIEKNPLSSQSSLKKLRSKFGISKSAACRARKELKFKVLRRVKQTTLSEKNKTQRVAFCEEVLAGINNGSPDLSRVFFSDESLVKNGRSAKNRNNDCVVVKAGTKKRDVPHDILISNNDNSNLHVMIALSVSKLGVVGPFFIPQGVKLNGETYKDLLEQQHFPAMGLAAAKAGLAPNEWHFQQDNAPSHCTAPVLNTIKKHTKPPPKWPACSYDLSPLDFFVFNEVKQCVEKMEPPPKREADIRLAVSLARSQLDQQKIDARIDNFAERCEKCLSVSGLRFDHLMK